MRPIAVLYATRQGAGQRVADHIVRSLGDVGQVARAVDVRTLPRTFDLYLYSAAVLIGSVHFGEHEPELVSFVRARRAALDSMKTGFLSLGLSEAVAENRSASPSLRAEGRERANRALVLFEQETRWRPRRAELVGGALYYSRFGPLTRLRMKKAASALGLETNSNTDVEFIDWGAVDSFVSALLRALDLECRPARAM